MNKLKASVVSLALVVLALAGNAAAADYRHSAASGAGLRPVVSYQVAKRPVRGNGHFVATHDGATYLFSSQANLDRFETDPERFVPAYNGYCAFGVSVGKKFVGDPEVYRVVNGRTYLNLDAGIQDEWLKDTDGRIASADAKWRKIRNKNPASL